MLIKVLDFHQRNYGERPKDVRLKKVPVLRWAVGLVFLWSITTGCIPVGGDLFQPRWDVEGKYVFYIEQRLLLGGPHAAESFRLYRALPDRTRRTKIASGNLQLGIGAPSIFPSPDGRYVAYVERFPSHLVAYDLAAGRTALKREFTESPFPMNVGWRSDSAALYYTSGAGIEVAPLDGSAPELTVPGRRYGRAWSADGRFLFHTTGEGWGGGNSLFIRDMTSGKERVVLAAPSGLIEHVVPSPNGTEIAFTLDMIAGETSAIYVASIQGESVRELWRGPADRLLGVAWSVENRSYLLGLEPELGVTSSILACLGPDHVLREVSTDRSSRFFDWSYHAGTRQLVQTAPQNTGFVVSTWTDCGDRYPELRLPERASRGSRTTSAGLRDAEDVPEPESEVYLLMLKDDGRTWCGYRNRAEFEAEATDLQPTETAWVVYAGNELDELAYQIEPESGDWTVLDRYAPIEGGMVFRRTSRMFQAGGLEVIQDTTIRGASVDPLDVTSVSTLDGKKAELGDVDLPEVPIQTTLSSNPVLNVVGEMRSRSLSKFCKTPASSGDQPDSGR